MIMTTMCDARRPRSSAMLGISEYYDCAIIESPSGGRCSEPSHTKPNQVLFIISIRMVVGCMQALLHGPHQWYTLGIIMIGLTKCPQIVQYYNVKLNWPGGRRSSHSISFCVWLQLAIAITDDDQRGRRRWWRRGHQCFIGIRMAVMGSSADRREIMLENGNRMEWTRIWTNGWLESRYSTAHLCCALRSMNGRVCSFAWLFW